MNLRVCPACGAKFERDLCLGCPSCGARAVGPPLARAERELPSWGRAFIVAATGVLMLATLLTASIIMLVQARPISFGFASILFASETGVWNLKWIELPVLVATLWMGIRLVRSIRREPNRFIGLRMARAGLVTSAIVAVIMLTLVGITVPERLLRHRDATNAAYYAKAYTIKRALLEYSQLNNGAVPSDINELKELPDPDGVIAEALRDFDSNGYKPSAVMAAASPKGKLQSLRGGALRNAAFTSNADLDHGVSFTNYELRGAGEDKILGTDDDVVLRNGVFYKASEISQSPNASANRPDAP